MSFRGPEQESSSRVRSATSVARRLLPLFAPYKGRLALVALALVVGTVVSLASPYLIGVAVDPYLPAHILKFTRYRIKLLV